MSSGEKRRGTNKTMEDMEKEMHSQLLLRDPSAALRLMNASSHSELNVPKKSIDNGRPNNVDPTDDTNSATPTDLKEEPASENPNPVEEIPPPVSEENNDLGKDNNAIEPVIQNSEPKIQPENNDLIELHPFTEDSPEYPLNKDKSNSPHSKGNDSPATKEAESLLAAVAVSLVDAAVENSKLQVPAKENQESNPEKKSLDEDTIDLKPSRAHVEIVDELNEHTQKPKDLLTWAEGSKEIFNLPQVQLFSINSLNNSADPIEVTSLRIVEVPGRIPKDASKSFFTQASLPPAFLQVGSWIYPLIPYNSPIYLSEEGHYIFPDLKADKPGASTGLVLPSNTYPDQIKEFEGILKTFAAIEELTLAPPLMFGNTTKLIHDARTEHELKSLNIAKNNEPEKSARPSIISSKASKSKDKVSKRSSRPGVQGPTTPPATATATRPDILNCGELIGNYRRDHPRTQHNAHYLSTKIADGIVAGAEVISRGITYGASKTSDLLGHGTGLLKSYSQGPPNPPRVIHRKLHNGVKVAKNYTGKFVELSSYVVDELSNATIALAVFLSPYLHETTTTLVTKATGSDPEESNYIVDNFLEVTTGTFHGMHLVYSGLQDAARILARSLTNNTVDVITHYYGPQAGEIIDDAAETVGNIALAGSQTKTLNPTSVMKKALKETGTVLLTKENRFNNS